ILGYDIMCPGNHEFDIGPAGLANGITAAMSHGGLPQMVQSNIKFSSSSSADDSLAALYDATGHANKPIKRFHVITTPSGLKVGCFGIRGADAAFYAPLKTPVHFSGNPADEAYSNLIMPALYTDIQPTVDELRNVEHVDVVIALSHSGVNLVDAAAGDDYNIA